MSLSASIKRITPNVAKKMMERNTNNFRSLDHRRVKRYSAIMKRGEWDLNGESIKTNCDGSIVDGQHRLAAVIASGVTIESLIVEGVQSVGTIDAGKPRQISDYLSHDGYKNATTLAALTKRLWQVSHGYNHGSRGVDIAFTYEQAKETIAARPWITNVLTASSRCRNVCSASMIGGIAAEAIDKGWGVALVESFLADVATGQGLDVDNPAYLLRERLIKNKTSKQKLTTKYICALIIKAWNAYAQGLTSTNSSISWRATGPNAESYPSVIDPDVSLV